MKKLPLVTMAAIMALSFSANSFAKGGKHMKHMKGSHHVMHKLMDGDGDGSVSRDEFQAFRAQNFAAADKNGDGSLDDQEFAALAKNMAEKRKKAMEMAKLKRAEKHFGKLDADGDGKISQAEFDAKGERSFIRMDQNDDGLLNKADRKKKMHKMKKMYDRP